MKAETAQQMLRLQQDANERRLRLAGNLGELRVRMQPRNLATEVKEASLAEFDRVTDELLDVATDLLEDSVDWVGRHRALAIGGAVAGVLAAAGVWYGRSRKPVPLYAAYNSGDHGLLADAVESAADSAGLKEEFAGLGDQAGRVYDAVRARARVVAADARGRATDAATAARTRAAVAGAAARAAVAGAAARAAAGKARAAADEAADWAASHRKDWPAANVVVGLLAGAVLGTLVPAKSAEGD